MKWKPVILAQPLHREPSSLSSAPSPLAGEQSMGPLFSPALQQAKAQRVQLDEAGGVALVIDLVGLEGDMGEAVEGLGRFAADDAQGPLVELQSHRAFHMLLALVDEGLEHLALGAEPEAVVDELGIARHDLVLEMRRAPIEGQALD